MGDALGTKHAQHRLMLRLPRRNSNTRQHYRHVCIGLTQVGCQIASRLKTFLLKPDRFELRRSLEDQPAEYAVTPWSGHSTHARYRPEETGTPNFNTHCLLTPHQSECRETVMNSLKPDHCLVGIDLNASIRYDPQLLLCQLLPLTGIR